jgi:hypothetical protein
MGVFYCRKIVKYFLSWPIDESLTDAALEKLMFPKASKETVNKRMPDFPHIKEKLEEFNKKLFQKKEDSRLDLFRDEEIIY